jgi:hemoglobin
MPSKQTLFEKYGGFAKVSRIVMSFYDRVLDSPVTSPYFADIDMRRLIDHQTKFIAHVMGGPASFTNDHLERVHARLHITETAFREAVDLLTETLEDHGFVDEDVKEVADNFWQRKNFIVTRGERVDI